MALAMLALAACGPSHDQVVKAFTGETEGTLIANWGTPTRTYRADDGTRYVTFVEERTLLSGGRVKCETTFKIANGKVAGGVYQGNDCH